MNKFILSHDNLDWYLNTKVGKVIAYFSNDSNNLKPVKEFYIANPPSIKDKTNHELFVMICDFASAKRMLRKIHIYAVV